MALGLDLLLLSTVRIGPLSKSESESISMTEMACLADWDLVCCGGRGEGGRERIWGVEERINFKK